MRGCYRCLLSYSNQTVHESIDRRLIVSRLLDLAAARLYPLDASVRRSSPTDDDLIDAALSDRARSLLRLLSIKKLRRPEEVATGIDGYDGKVDLVYRCGGLDTAVVAEDQALGHRPDPAVLAFAGWNVIHIRLDEDLETIVAANPAVFGQEVR